MDERPTGGSPSADRWPALRPAPKRHRWRSAAGSGRRSWPSGCRPHQGRHGFTAEHGGGLLIRRRAWLARSPRFARRRFLRKPLSAKAHCANARSSRHVGQPEHILANPFTTHQAERRTRPGEIGFAPTAAAGGDVARPARRQGVQGTAGSWKAGGRRLAVAWRAARATSLSSSAGRRSGAGPLRRPFRNRPSRK